MNTSKQPTFLRRPDPQPEPFQYATLLTEGKRPLFTAHELRNLGYTALLTLGVILALAELDSPHIIDWTLGFFIGAPSALVALYLIINGSIGRIE